MIVVLTGAPGAGKGTQADLLAQRLGFRKVSTGDALRRQVKLGTEIGKKAGALMAAGNLVPDDVLFEILRQEVGQDASERILPDGYPRNIAQAKTLKDAMGQIHPVKAAIHLEVVRDELVDRISGRRVCGQCGKSFHLRYSPSKTGDRCDNCSGALLQRPDDHPDKVGVRLDVYERETKPILDFYRQEDLYRQVDGNRDQEQVYESLRQVMADVH